MFESVCFSHPLVDTEYFGVIGGDIHKSSPPGIDKEFSPTSYYIWKQAHAIREKQKFSEELAL